MTKAIGGWPLLSPQTRHTWANRDAIADVARQLAANALQMYGHVQGGDLLAENTPAPASMQNPGAGVLGHDHSGGLWGRPLYRDIATFCGDNHDNLGSVETNSSPWVFTAVSLPAAEESQVFFADFAVWVPGCQPGRDVGAYNSLAWNAKVWISVATNVVTADELHVVLQNKHPGATNEQQLEIANPAAATFRVNASDDERLTVVPGEWNRLRLGIDYNPSGSGSARSLTLVVQDLQLGVFDDLCT